MVDTIIVALIFIALAVLNIADCVESLVHRRRRHHDHLIAPTPRSSR